jgi:hypothetical protein
MEHFYEAAIDFVRKAKAGERKAAKERADLAQERILSGKLIPEELKEELRIFSEYVGIILYWRGYKNAEHNRRVLERIERPRKEHENFNKAVKKMLEKSPEMEVEDICHELDRRKIRGEFDVKWRPEEFGPDGRSWAEKPIPGSVERAIERIRNNVKSTAHAMQKRLLFSPPPRKREPRKRRRN